MSDEPTAGPVAGDVVVWASAGSDASELLHGLTRRGATLRRVSEPAGVMLEAAARPVHAVVVVEPSEPPRAQRLRMALQRYYPKIRLWQYLPASADQGPRLRPFPEAPEPATDEPGAAPVRSMDTPSNGQPGPEDRTPMPVADRPPDEQRSLISREELAMLIGSAIETGKQDRE